MIGKCLASLRAGRIPAGTGLAIDALGGHLVGAATDLQTIGSAPLRVERRYESSCARGALGVGWSLALDGRLVDLPADGRHVIHAGRNVVEVERRGGVIARLEVRVAGTPVCVRRFEHDAERLIRVRDPRERVLEQYEYDGALLVGAQIGSTARRYFEYDDRGRRARCVRTWSATGRFDRALTYTRDATVIDDGVGETWIVRRHPLRGVIDPELRESELSESAPAPATRYEVGFDVDGRLASIHLGGHVLRTRTDAIGRVTAVTSGAGDLVTWAHDGPEVRAVLERAGRTVSSLHASAEDWTQLRSLVDGPSGRRLAARFDPDRLLDRVETDCAVVSIERDGEGRATSMTCAGAEAKLTRDRAGRVLSIALEDGRVITDGVPSQLGPIDGGLGGAVLEWSPDAARALLTRCGSGLGVADLDAADALSAHVGVVLAHARALGLRLERRGAAPGG